MATAIRFPSETRYATPDRFHDAIYRWMCRLTAHHLYFNFFKLGHPLPSLDELAAWVTETTWPRVSHLVPDYTDNRSKHHFDFDREVIRCAQFCLETFDGPMVEARARRGGRRSHRSTKRPMTDLLRLDGMTAAEQAAELGVSVRTIRRYRAKVTGTDPLLWERSRSPRRRKPAPVVRFELLEV